jgi:hypothetical protein
VSPDDKSIYAEVKLPAGWSTASTPPHPLGVPLKCAWRAGSEPSEIKAILETLTWCSQPTAEILFFPVGIGVLMIKAELLVSQVDGRSHAFLNWKDDDTLYSMRTPNERRLST